MNARTIFKRLSANRRTVLWGRRAILTVSLPASVIPVPAPPRDYCEGWGHEMCVGQWVIELPDGRNEHHVVSRMSSGSPPPDEERPILTERDGDWWSWWKGTTITVTPSDNGRALERRPIDAAAVAAHAAYVAWEDAYLHGTRDADRGPVLDAFLEAGWHARAVYPEVVGDRLLFAYSVKYVGERETMLRFSADLARAIQVARANGVDVRVRR